MRLYVLVLDQLHGEAFTVHGFRPSIILNENQTDTYISLSIIHHGTWHSRELMETSKCIRVTPQIWMFLSNEGENIYCEL